MDITEPVRKYNSQNRNSEINKSLYLQRLKDDLRMSDKAALLQQGQTIFESLTSENIVQPFASEKIDLTKDFWNFKIVNGAQALKNGFFKIVKEPELRDIAGVPTWAAYVLYNSGSSQEFYLYYANIGTLVNRYAIGGNLGIGKFITMPTSTGKEQFLTSLLNKVIYVSRAEFVTDSQYSNMKEVLWFVLG